MFQIYGDYSPLDVLGIAQSLDPEASFSSWENDTPELAHVVLFCKTKPVRVSFTPCAPSLLCVDGPRDLEVALLCTLGGMREEGGQEHYAPLTPHLSSDLHKDAVRRLSGSPLFEYCRRAGMVPTYTVLSSMDLTPHPLSAGQTYLAHDCFSLMQEVLESLSRSGLTIESLGGVQGDVRMTYEGQSVDIALNKPGSDLVLLDLIERRPGLFDGLGTITLPEETPQNAAALAKIRENLPRSAQELQHALPRILGQVTPSDRTLAEVLSAAQKSCVHDMTHWRGSITMTSYGFNQRTLSPVRSQTSFAGVVSQAMMNNAAVSLLTEEDAAPFNDMTDVFAALIKQALPESLRLVRWPDPSGASVRDVLAIYPVGGCREDAAYVHCGGAYASKEERNLMSLIVADTPRPYPFSIGGHPVQAECVAQIMKTHLRAQSMEVYTEAHIPQRERKNYLRRAAQGLYFAA